MSEDPEFKRASDLTNLDRVEKARGNRTWVNPVNQRIDVSDLPVCPKENGGCNHHVRRHSPIACYNDQGEQVGCDCVCDLYLPKNGGCRGCGD